MSYLLVLALVAFGLPLAIGFSQRVRREVHTQAMSQASFVALAADRLVEDDDRAALQQLVVSAAHDARGRVLIVDGAGRILADSFGTTTIGVSYRTRPEIALALRGRRVQTERESRTLGERLLVTALPIHGSTPIGAVRISQTTAAITRAVRRNVLGLGIVAFAVLLFGLLVAIVLARRLSEPLRRLEVAAGRVADGDLSTRVEEAGPREQRSLARAFNAMTARVARTLSAQQDFVADASHHLRTPLAGVRLRLEALGADAGEGEGRTHVDAAIGELDRLSGMIDELLALSQTGERDAPGELLAMEEVVEDALERWRPALTGRGQSLAYDPGDGARSDTFVMARSDIDRVLDVLLDNAGRYAPAGSVITVVRDGTDVAVLDEGPGVADDELETVFERFARGSVGRRSGPGSGLGLPLARELARRWDGDVTITAGEPGGARATVIVPSAHVV